MTFREFWDQCDKKPCYEGTILAFKDAPSRDMADLYDAWIGARHDHIWWVIWNTPWIRGGVMARIKREYGDLTELSYEDRIRLFNGAPNPFRS